MLDDFFKLPPEVMTALATVIGFAILPETTADEQNSLGNFLMLIAQVIETNASQKQLLEAKENSCRLACLEAEIDGLKREIEKLKK